MGSPEVDRREDEQRCRAFGEALLDDLAALKLMLAGLCRSWPGAHRCRTGNAADARLLASGPVACVMLAHLDPSTFTTEIGWFNLEANLTPLIFSGGCFEQLERDRKRVVLEAGRAASMFEASVLLAGTCSSARAGDLTLRNLTPRSRYEELNPIVMRLRSGVYHVSKRGGEELDLLH